MPQRHLLQYLFALPVASFLDDLLFSTDIDLSRQAYELNQLHHSQNSDTQIFENGGVDLIMRGNKNND